MTIPAIRVQRFGGPEVLEWGEAPALRPGPGQVLVRLHAAGVNPVEAYIRSGQYGRLPELPYTPGSDGAGRVEALGEGVKHFTPGQRVYLAGSLTGTYADSCLCAAEQVHPLPESITFAQGAALGVPYATAYRALFQRGRVQLGETVLIHGGTGGTGLAAVQLARAAGLHVLATGGSEEGRTLLKAQGAEAAFDHSSEGYASDLLHHTEGRGVNLILEMRADANLGRDLGLLGPRGRVAVIGSRGPVEINPRDAMVREAEILGVMLMSATPEELTEIHRAIGHGLSSGELLPIIGQQYPLPQAAEAHHAILASHPPGKLVLIV